MTTTFIRLLDIPIEKKAAALKSASHRDESAVRTYNVDPHAFSKVPGSPFAYWIDDNIRKMYSERPAFELEGVRSVRLGASTKYDARFVRLWSELPAIDPHVWSTYANGGRFGRFFQDYFTIIKSGLQFKELGAYLTQKFPYLNGDPGWILHLENDYSKPAIAWPLRTHSFSPHALPSNTVFSARTYAAYVNSSELASVGALLASKPVDFLLKVMLGRFEYPEFVTGVVRALPWTSEQLPKDLVGLFKEGWLIARRSAVADECSRCFLLPASLLHRILPPSRETLETVQASVDDLAFRMYGFDAEQRATIEAWALRSLAGEAENIGERGDEENTHASSDTDDDAPSDANLGLSSQLLSWIVGVVFGRFDPRLATGERMLPPDPEPFDPLPERSPGMWPSAEEAAKCGNVFVDDEGHEDDLVARIKTVAERVKIDLEADVRIWIAKAFFPLHIKMYSKSRRKAPIYWQLATPSNRYSIWLYIHAFTKDTLYRVQNEYVAPKLAQEERALEALLKEISDGGTGTQRKALTTQESFVEELRSFREEVMRVAPLWDPNLDDGVLINFAPLWRLVPQHKPWQKEVKAAWDALCGEEYDWAHLAMHLWPERVVPKCATDRSLAIAHGLEDVFWVEGDEEKWTARTEPTYPIEALVAERSSEAVKAALKSLMDAPDTAGPAKRGRKSARA